MIPSPKVHYCPNCGNQGEHIEWSDCIVFPPGLCPKCGSEMTFKILGEQEANRLSAKTQLENLFGELFSKIFK